MLLATNNCSRLDFKAPAYCKNKASLNAVKNILGLFQDPFLFPKACLVPIHLKATLVYLINVQDGINVQVGSFVKFWVILRI